MKNITLLLVLLILLPSISAVTLTVDELSENEVLIPGLGQTSFLLKITNHGPSDNFMFYNYLGFEMFPVGTVFIGNGQTKEVNLQISPIGELTVRGPYTFEYYIQGQDGTEQAERLVFRISELSDSFEIGSGEINPDSNSMTVYVYNKVNFNFSEITTQFSSTFFDFEETFDLGANEKKEFTVNLEKSDFDMLMAGFYTMTAEIKVGDDEITQEGTIEFAEKDILIETPQQYGFIINTQLIKKTNEGNTMTPSETVIKKNIISRLFTSFSPQPDNVERNGFAVYYRWVSEIAPGETLEIAVKTNWFLPIIIILLIVSIVLFVKQYTTTNISLKKRVSFVRAKGADFGLKVSIHVNAKKYVERVNVIDRLPPLVKLYEKFGIERPSRINEKNRTLEWSFEKLEAGETRILSYIIYSKVGIMGRFALPSASAIYEKDGDLKESSSNKAFFVAEQRDKEE